MVSCSTATKEKSVRIYHLLLYTFTLRGDIGDIRGDCSVKDIAESQLAFTEMD